MTITDYARKRMEQRKITEDMIIETLENPDIPQPAHSGRYAYAKFFSDFLYGKYVVVVYELRDNELKVINVIPRDHKKVEKLFKRMGDKNADK